MAKHMYTAHMYKARATIIAARKRNHMLHSCTLTNLHVITVFSPGARRQTSLLRVVRWPRPPTAPKSNISKMRVVQTRCRPLDLRNRHTPEGPPPGGHGGGDDRVDCLMDIFILVMPLFSCNYVGYEYPTDVSAL